MVAQPAVQLLSAHLYTAYTIIRVVIIAYLSLFQSSSLGKAYLCLTLRKKFPETSNSSVCVFFGTHCFKRASSAIFEDAMCIMGNAGWQCKAEMKRN